MNVAGRFGAVAGSAATADWLESALAETKPALVHLACHGVFDPRHGERSGLLLSGASEAALVSLRQLASYDWSDALVVLSSCTSGRHELRAGDELAGLGWAILGGGARALVVSLWRVPDLSTALLMSAFYDALSWPRPDLPQISAALDTAQSWLRDLTARDLIDWAITRARQKGQLVLAARAVMAAHHAAGQIDAYGFWNGIYLQAWEDRLIQPPTESEWERQRGLAQLEDYARRPFHHPANWAAFSLLGPG